MLSNGSCQRTQLFSNFRCTAHDLIGGFFYLLRCGRADSIYRLNGGVSESYRVSFCRCIGRRIWCLNVHNFPPAVGKVPHNNAGIFLLIDRLLDQTTINGVSRPPIVFILGRISGDFSVSQTLNFCGKAPTPAFARCGGFKNRFQIEPGGSDEAGRKCEQSWESTPLGRLVSRAGLPSPLSRPTGGG